MKYDKPELGELTEERIEKIDKAIEDSVKYGYNLQTNKYRYFFVDKFYQTDFKKITPRAPMGSRIFDLTKVINVEELPQTKEIAELLKTKTWE